MSYYPTSSKYRTPDDLFRAVILKERPSKCLWCDETKPVDIAHILDKGRYRKMRYRKENVITLCRYCHRRWHDNPLDASTFLAKLLGNDYYDELRRIDKTLRLPDLKLLTMVFRQELKG